MATTQGLRHVIRDQHQRLSHVIEQIGNGEKANAKVILDDVIVVLQAVQTAVNAATNATLTTSTISTTYNLNTD